MPDSPTPAQAAEKAIREALEAGATSAFYTDPRDDNRWRENERLALACSPEALTALLSQLAEMRAEVERLETRAELEEQAHVCAAEERDHLQAVVKDLRADAMRYRWLRHGDNDERILCSNPFAEDDEPSMFLPRNAELDDAIDAAQSGTLP
jgi:hypothetical protein